MPEKRILCLIDCLGIGGAERQMIGLALLLKQEGYIVDLVKYHNQKSSGDLECRNNLDVITLSVNDSAIMKLLAVRKFIKQRGGYDCVIAYKDGPCLISSLLKAFKMKFKLIVSERNTSQVFSLRERVKFWLFRFADYIVPNSYTQEHVIKVYFPYLRKKIETITNFTDTKVFVPGTKVCSTVFTVLTTARVARQKNVLRYLDAIANLRERGIKNVHFEWYGDVQVGQEDYWCEIQEKIKDLQLENYISFYPATVQVLEKYQQCDLFCLPSNYEGFPNVVCEAMSCQKPIVCSRVCDNPFIVRENENGLLFDNTNVIDMADKLQMIIQKSEDELLVWGKRSREIAESLFSQQAFVAKYVNLIEN